MSRSTQKAPASEIIEKRPLYVMTAYGLGVFGALVLIASALFTLGGYLSSDDTAVSISPVGIIVWGGLVVIAVATWLLRRRGRL